MNFWSITGVLFLLAAGWLARYFTRDNRKFFRRTAGGIAHVETAVTARNETSRTERFTIRATRKFSLTGYIRVPEPAGRKYPACIVLGGLFTGKEIVDLVCDIPGIEPVIIATMDYPYGGEKRIKPRQVVPAVPAIRRAAMNSVRGVLLMLEMLLRRPDVDAGRIHFVGVSFGAFFGMAAAACDPRIRSVASLYGGGRIHKLIATNLPYRIPLVNAVIGRLSQWIVYPVEPLRYARHIAPRPLLIVAGSDDERFPRDCAQALFDRAGAPRDIVWFTSRHVQPARNELTRELAETYAAWMKGRGLLREAEK